jgi:hypothetical protein
MKGSEKKTKSKAKVSLKDILNDNLAPNASAKLKQDFCKKFGVKENAMHVFFRKDFFEETERLKFIAERLTNGSIDQLLKFLTPNRNKANF